MHMDIRVREQDGLIALPRAKVLLPFATLVGQWDLLSGSSNMQKLHQGTCRKGCSLYRACIQIIG